MIDKWGAEIHREVYVRFRGGCGETYKGDLARRTNPILIALYFQNIVTSRVGTLPEFTPTTATLAVSLTTALISIG